MPLSCGYKLASYEIVSALGSGGMGDVYRARDARLGREVALKVLPPEVTNEPGRLEQFDREARAIAALNHPHIAAIFSTEEADGIRFLTMELVDGTTLGDLIAPPGVSLTTFLDLSIPLADALSAAHQKQITHRHLKPGNVMVTADGRVKVLDFGVARMEAGVTEHSMAATQVPITHHGMLVGTMPYMSPEQVEGRALDARTDLFSLGVMFHELLSGERPFKGPSPAALMSSILHDIPPIIAARRADLPEPLARLVERLLEKRPADRVQTARDVYHELRQIRRSIETSDHQARSSISPIAADHARRARPPEASIAVLPFADLSEKAYQLLLQARALVTQRGPAIARSIEYFERAIALDPHLVDAYAGLADAYCLMGLYGLARSSDVLPRAQAAVARVLAIDANHPDALATLANIKQAFEWHFAEARALTDRVLAADPHNVRALAEGAVMLATAAPSHASAELSAVIQTRIAKARRIDPLNASVMSIESLVCFFTGHIEEAIEAAARSYAADRHNFTANWSRVIAFAAGGYEDEAIEAAEEAFGVFKRHPSILAEVAAIYASRGNVFTAESIFHELSERAKTSYVSGAVRAAVAASAGFAEDARALVASAIAERDTFLTFYKLPACRALRADPACAKLLNDMVYVKDALR